MEELLIEKLSAAKELKSFTEEIMSLSLKTEFDKVNSMIDERQVKIENIDIINDKINKALKDNKGSDSKNIKLLKKEIRAIFTEISNMDNLIRKNINRELDNIRKNLNQPDNHSKTLNMKA